MFTFIDSLHANRSTSYTHSFEELINKIRTPNDGVEKARELDKYKNPSKYEKVKEYEIEAFFPNCFNESSTGYIYLDIDFKTNAEAIAYKQELINKHTDIITACWLSLSSYGIGMLVRVKGVSSSNFKQYWNELNILFDNKLDTRTRTFKQLCCISYDSDIYVNTTTKEYTLANNISNKGGAIPVIPKGGIITPTAPPNLNSVYWQTPIPDSEFENVNTPKVYPEGRQILKIELHQYQFKKIPIGKRNSTLGAFCMQLIMINQYAVTRQQLLNALLSINSKYTVEPLTKDEVIKIFNANYQRFETKELDIRPYLKTKKVFFHRECQISKNERISIATNALNKIKGRGKEYCEEIIYEAIEILQDGITPITRARLMEFTGLKVDSIKRYWKPFKSIIDDYNNGLKKDVLPEVVDESVLLEWQQKYQFHFQIEPVHNEVKLWKYDKKYGSNYRLCDVEDIVDYVMY